MSICRSASRARKDAGKSSPTTPTSRGRVKKLAAYEKNVAEPPSASSAMPCGVSIESKATVPTTNTEDIPDTPLCPALPGLLGLRCFWLQGGPALDQGLRDAFLDHLACLVGQLA